MWRRHDVDDVHLVRTSAREKLLIAEKGNTCYRPFVLAIFCRRISRDSRLISMNELALAMRLAADSDWGYHSRKTGHHGRCSLRTRVILRYHPRAWLNLLRDYDLLIAESASSHNRPRYQVWCRIDEIQIRNRPMIALNSTNCISQDCNDRNSSPKDAIRRSYSERNTRFPTAYLNGPTRFPITFERCKRKLGTSCYRSNPRPP